MAGEPRLPPTPRKLRHARRRGEVALGRDLPAALGFAAAVAMLAALGATVLKLVHALMQHAWDLPLAARSDADLVPVLAHATQVLLFASLPLALVVALVAALGCMVQVGALMAWPRIKPDIRRLNPVHGLKRIFSSGNALQLLKMVVKATLLAGLVVVLVGAMLDNALRLTHATPAGALQAGGAILRTLLGWAALIYVVMSAFDLAIARAEFTKQQRMSVDELRREHRETEGDPVHASRRRGAFVEAVFMALDDRVRAASALICAGNTAVALQYLGDKDLPRVVARGIGDMAAQMRRIAGQASIPIAFDAALAGRLYDEVAEGRAIPRSLYAPVAELLRWAQGPR